MKIALLGYGKMGKTIERQALAAGHEIVLKVSSANPADLTPENLRRADVAIEFSRPESAFENIALCLENSVPVVCGATGWLDRLDEVKNLCNSLRGAFFYTSNFSIGVNLFFAVNRYLTALMNDQSQYEPSLEEIHHTQKIDAPSGTALTLAQGILETISRKKNWVNELVEATGKQSIPQKTDDLLIVSKRIEAVPGTHVVTWTSEVDTIEIKHTAHSREGFAAGALAAAAWLIGKKGCFEMKDLLEGH